MAETTKISWCDSTWNPWIGCTPVSEACTHCYAERENKQRKWVEEWGKGIPRHLTSEHNWSLPLKWNKEAKKSGIWRKVFCGSLCDILDTEVPIEWQERLWDLIRETPHLDWLLLTKRIEEGRYRFPLSWLENGFSSQVWLGVTAENQKCADERIPELLLYRNLVKVLWISVEPMLGEIDLQKSTWFNNLHESKHNLPPNGIGLDWVICGGESGPHHRPLDIAVAQDLREQCHKAGVKFFMKQDSGLRPGTRGRIPDDLWIQEFPE